jgi:AGCS family alanine or glycine:cation symporter
MSTSLGMGSIAGPPVAIAIGGPGALFWLVVYAFFGCVAKYTEVVLAVKFRQTAPDGTIIGGPTSYLWQVHHYLAYWYGALTLVLFAGWSGLQSKTLAEIYLTLGIPEYITGIGAAILAFFMLMGGAKRIGEFSSKLVPFMCITYLCSSLIILLQDLALLQEMISLVFTKAFSATAATGGFVGASTFTALRHGIFKGVFVTEAGMGTAAIPHAQTDSKIAKNQGILAMYSVAIDTFFCLISGFVTLVTGVWTSGVISNALIFEAFKIGLPAVGSYMLIFSLTLFIVGTLIGNGFNGSKNFAFLTNNRWITWYYVFVAILIMFGAVAYTPTLWAMMEILLPLAALPNLLGITILALRHRKELL